MMKERTLRGIVRIVSTISWPFYMTNGNECCLAAGMKLSGSKVTPW